jgi:hypothetical protein
MADIVAVQLYANGLDHPQGLMSRLFDCFYHEEVCGMYARDGYFDAVFFSKHIMCKSASTLLIS